MEDTVPEGPSDGARRALRDTASPAAEQASVLFETLRRTCDLAAYDEGTAALLDAFPQDVHALRARGAARHFLHDDDGAEALAAALLDLAPGDRSARLLRAITRLRAGRHREAWPDYLARIGPALSTRRAKILPPELRWTSGKPAAPLLLVPEQGLGDSIQFLRLLPMGAARSSGVFAEVEPVVFPLVAGRPGFGAVVRPGDTVSIRSWALLGDLLPVIMPSRDDAAGTGGGYLGPVAARAPHPEVSRLRGLRVGVAWRGSPSYQFDFARSMRLCDLAPLLDVPGVTLASLSRQPLDPEADPSVDAATARRVVDLSGSSSPVGELSRVIAGLDVVVTVDSLVAHLAGAMGKPVLLLLSAIPDWRWGTSGRTTPWYDSMTIFRQRRLGDWSAPVAAAAAALSAGLA